MKTNAHPSFGTGDIGVKGSGKSNHGRLKEGASQIIADIDNLLQLNGRHSRRVRERDMFLVKKTSVASSLKRETQASSASVGRANMLHPYRIENIWQGYRTGDITLLRRGVRALQKSLASLYARLKAAERKLQGDLLGATCQLSALRIHSKMLIGPNIQFVLQTLPKSFVRITQPLPFSY